ncbi:MAG TPA: alpha/beta hydrolase [Caulobacteraceae bacterium]|nr:alpha/beta hydrolase [Caulobacteraceae bacterium]
MAESATAPDPRMNIYSRPQQLVEVEPGRRLNVNVTGAGSPTVILSAGGGCSTIHWGLVQARLARTNRVFSFDRAGMGFSDPGPTPRTTGRSVDDLRAALAALGVGPPYVLVGHSMGSFDTRLFAFRNAGEVAGMVLVDPRGDQMNKRMTAIAPFLVKELQDSREQVRRNAEIAATKPAPGTADYESLVSPDDPNLTSAVNAAFRDAALRPSYWQTLASEGDCLDGVSADELAGAKRHLGAMPLIVLTAAAPPFPCPPQYADAVMAMWRTSHDELAALSDRGVRRDVPNVGHMIPTLRPEVVVDAIREVCAAIA